MQASAGRKKTISSAPGSEYRGKQAKTGNSSGFRFEGALFKSHPEFRGDVVAHVIAPGRMLVTADVRKETADPVMESFLAFLGQDIAERPAMVRPLDSKLIERMDALVDGIEVDPHAPLDSEVVL